MTVPVGDPLWQMVILWVAGLFLLWEIWRGWRAGVIRSGLQVAGIVVSSIVFLVVAKIVALPFGGMNSFSGLVTGGAVGLGAGVITLFIFWLVGALLFKRTSQQKAGMFRFLWGLGGAFFGAMTALIILWGAILAVRGFGTVGEGYFQTPSGTAADGSPRAAYPAFIDKTFHSMAVAKQSLELGQVGKVVKAVDPGTPDIYEFFNAFGRVYSDPHTLIRLTQYPGIQDLMKSPAIQHLANDPMVVKAIDERDYASLLQNKGVLAVAQNPAVAAQLGKIDLMAALKFALETPTPSPSPSPAPTAKKKK